MLHNKQKIFQWKKKRSRKCFFEVAQKKLQKERKIFTLEIASSYLSRSCMALWWSCMILYGSSWFYRAFLWLCMVFYCLAWPFHVFMANYRFDWTWIVFLAVIDPNSFGLVHMILKWVSIFESIFLLNLVLTKVSIYYAKSAFYPKSSPFTQFYELI